MCADLVLRAGLGASCEVWLFQMSDEQQRHARNAGPARRVCAQQGVCGVAELANGTTIRCAPRLASILVVRKRIFRFLLKQALMSGRGSFTALRFLLLLLLHV